MELLTFRSAETTSPFRGDQPPNLCPERRPCSFEVSIMRLICHFVQAASEVVSAARDAKSRDMLIVPLGP